MTTGLVIGRFQPFHNGHEILVEHALNECDKVIIGIGSAEKCYSNSNPFTCGERIVMIMRWIHEKKYYDRVTIVPIRNIDKWHLWVRHVQNYCPPFDRVFLGDNEPIGQLFEKEGIDVRLIGRIQGFSGEWVRRLFNDHFSDHNFGPVSPGEELGKMIPKSVLEYIKTIHEKNDLEWRIKNV